MRCMKKETTHGDKNPNPRKIKYLKAGNGKSWDTYKVNYIRGVTTLHHYERISSRDLGVEKRRVLRTEVILAFPGGFTVGMV